MYDFKVKIADLLIGIHSKYEYSYKKCEKYIENSENEPIFEVFSQNIDKNKYFDPLLCQETSEEYVEFISILEEIANKLPKYDALIIHGASIKHNNKGILFIAPSGIGKTTHIKLWKNHIKDLVAINGDKTIVRLINNEYRIYGSPWQGKEDYGSNDSAILNSIVILKRDNKDSIKKINKEIKFDDVVKQVMLPKESDKLIESMNLVNEIFTKTNVYELNATKEDSAFYVTYKEIFGEEYEDK